MKAILEFDLSEEGEEMRMAIDGHKWLFAMWDLDQWLRNKLKYEDLTEDEDKAYSATREWLRDLLYYKGISFEVVS